MRKKILLILAVVVLVSGCIRFGGNRADNTAGVCRSTDFGQSWDGRHLLLHSGGTASIDDVNVINLQFDPQDTRAIYANTRNGGLLYSYDGADSWQQAQQIGSGLIEDVVIDPRDKCIVYATYANTILKTEDCNRTWREVYIDSRGDRRVLSLAIDPFNSRILYAGNSGGDIIKSTDGGATWRTMERLDNPVADIFIDPYDNKIIYAATRDRGIYKSFNSGVLWADINEGLREFSGSLEYRQLVFDVRNENTLFLSSRYGLLKSRDGGIVWEPIPLITQVATANITALAVDPSDSNRIYYTTETTFYSSTDGGTTWQTRRLPTAARASALLIHPDMPHLIYLGKALPER